MRKRVKRFLYDGRLLEEVKYMAKKFCIFLLTNKELYYILIKSDTERTMKRELDIDSFYAIVAQLVERHLAKVETAGSSPVYRFSKKEIL